MSAKSLLLCNHSSNEEESLAAVSISEMFFSSQFKSNPLSANCQARGMPVNYRKAKAKT